MTLRLGKLPDRTPIKLTLALEPELHARLASYAALYEETYGAPARIEDLAPVMLDRFMAADRYFRRAGKVQSRAKKGD